MEANCSIDLQNVENYDYISGYGMSIPFVLTRKMQWDGFSPKPNPLYKIDEDGSWRLMLELLRLFNYSSTP